MLIKPNCLTDEHILFLDDLWKRGVRDFSIISLEYAFGIKEYEAKEIVLYYKYMRGIS